MKHRTIPVNHTETNEKIEVFHKTLKVEHIYLKEEYEALGEVRENIDEFVYYYNGERLHKGIDYVTPNQKHRGEAERMIHEREKQHQKTIERQRTINRERSENGKTKEGLKESV